MTSRNRFWQILEVARPGDRASHLFDVCLLTLILLNIAAVILETVNSIEARWGVALSLFEWASVTIFSVEYLARLWAAPADPRYAGAIRGRLRYMITPLALIDLMAVLPFYVPFASFDLRFARALRLTRIFRVAKLGRYVIALDSSPTWPD